MIGLTTASIDFSVATRRPIAKRALDFAVALLALAALWPLFVVAALGVRLSSPGPVFFVQTRVGLQGKTFGMLKFRSMCVDAEALRPKLEVESDRDGLCFKARQDPRITPVGRILRRFSIDELPQLINVLKGEMSLVGPRPALPTEVAAYPAQALGRLAVLPGITGVWQTSGRADVGFEQMIEMDLAYVRKASLWGDLTLLARTAVVVLNGRGAY